MKIVTILALAAATTVATLPASAAVYSFRDEAKTYQVHDTIRDGVRVIEGTDSTGAKFAYEVRGTQVTGTYNGEPVSFTVRAPRPQRIAMR